jgi:5'-deoxynucleotidase YfbR-like HD superfamily hydrolase
LEAVTGDLPTPIKKRLTELGSAEHALMSEMGVEFTRIRTMIQSRARPWPDITVIVGFADSIEALAFLHMESLLGNKAVHQVAWEIRQRVEREYPNLPFGDNVQEEDKASIWNNDILPIIDGRVRNWPTVA